MKILITDDEEPARQRLKRLLQDVDIENEIVGEAVNGKEALEMVHKFRPDVLLLDIKMPGMDGLEAAMHLTKMDDSPTIIFVTAYDEYAVEAFETHAVDYLLKPIRRERLQQALHKAQLISKAMLIALTQAREDGPKARTHISVHMTGNLQLVPVSQIFYFRADQKYVTVRYPDGELLIEEPLKDLELEFGDQFLRIHRNALIARKYISGLEKQGIGRFFLTLTSIEDRLEVSRRHVSMVRKIIKQGKQ